MWEVLVKLVSMAGQTVEIKFSTVTRAEAIEMLERLGIDFQPTDFFGPAKGYHESEGMLPDDKTCVWLTFKWK